MGYRHIGIKERRAIARLLQEGRSIRQIAAKLNRSPSTVSREVNRNTEGGGEYAPTAANEKARARRTPIPLPSRAP